MWNREKKQKKISLHGSAPLTTNDAWRVCSQLHTSKRCLMHYSSLQRHQHNSWQTTRYTQTLTHAQPSTVYTCPRNGIRCITSRMMPPIHYTPDVQHCCPVSRIQARPLKYHRLSPCPKTLPLTNRPSRHRRLADETRGNTAHFPVSRMNRMDTINCDIGTQPVLPIQTLPLCTHRTDTTRSTEPTPPLRSSSSRARGWCTLTL